MQNEGVSPASRGTQCPLPGWMDMHVALPVVTSCEASESCEWRKCISKLQSLIVYLLRSEAPFRLRSWFLYLHAWVKECLSFAFGDVEQVTHTCVLFPPGMRKAQRRCLGNRIVQLRYFSTSGTGINSYWKFSAQFRLILKGLDTIPSLSSPHMCLCSETWTL